MRTSRVESLLILVKWLISMAVKALRWRFGVAAAQAAEHFEVPVEGEPGVKSADDVDFGGTGGGGFACDAEDVVVGEFVGTGFAPLAVEFAEFAGEGADVGVIDVAVDVVVGEVSVFLPADEIG